MKNYIGIFDSGIGGTTTLKEIQKLLPNENYLYFSDSKNNPYGEKSKNELYNIVKHNVNKLLLHHVKLIVIACNTVTTQFINVLRQEYPNVLFIGTEPAVKVACDNNYKNTLVMATPATINSEKLHCLINKNKKPNQKFTLLECFGLANAIENNDDILIDNTLKKLFKNYTNKNFDSIVLGCTHYPIIKDKIKAYFPNAKLIDGNLGVAKRVKYILSVNNLFNNSKTKGQIKFITNKKNN